MATETEASSNFAFLNGLIRSLQMAPENKSKQVQCMQELGALLLSLGLHIRAFGSAANGFQTYASDLDVTCFRQRENKEERARAIEELKQTLLPLLHQHPKIDIIEEIWTARIPILKLRFAGALELDLSCYNTEPLPNTQLLKAYATLHQVVRDLVVLVKLWAKTEGVCGPKQGHLSSYALTLMALYFMQVDSTVQLPCFDTSLFTGDMQIPEDTRIEWNYPQSHYDLLCRFFCFYSLVYSWGCEVTSVRMGQRQTTLSYPSLNGTSYGRLHIEDPFLQHRNLNCVLGVEQERMLYEKICEAGQEVQAGKLPAGLLQAHADLTQQHSSASSSNMAYASVGGVADGLGEPLKRKESGESTIDGALITGKANNGTPMACGVQMQSAYTAYTPIAADRKSVV